MIKCNRWQCVGSNFDGNYHDLADLPGNLGLCMSVKSLLKSLTSPDFRG